MSCFKVHLYFWGAVRRGLLKDWLECHACVQWLGRKERFWAFCNVNWAGGGTDIAFWGSCSQKSCSASSVSVVQKERRLQPPWCKSESSNSADAFHWCLRKQHLRPFVGTATCSLHCEVVILVSITEKSPNMDLFAWKRTQSCELREIPTSFAMKEFCKVF